MNGFSVMAESYAKAGLQGTISQEESTKKVRIFDFLSTCNEEDFCTLFDSTAFNEIVMCYVRRAVLELVNEDVLNDEQARVVRNRVNTLFSEQTAMDILK